MAARRELLGDDSPQVVFALSNLGRLLRERGRFDEAEPLFRESLELRRRVLGEEHADVARLCARDDGSVGPELRLADDVRVLFEVDV
jgi:hypothetical protein